MNESSCRPALFLSSSHDHRADCSSASGGFLFSSFSTDRYGLVRSNTILQHHAASADVKAMRCFESKTEWTGCWLFGSDKSDLSDVSDARQNRQCGVRKRKDNGRCESKTEWTGCWLFGSDKSDMSDVSDARQNRQCGTRRHKGTGQQQKNTDVRRKTTLPIACCASAQRQAQSQTTLIQERYRDAIRRFCKREARGSVSAEAPP